jgi:hypothetical protein
VDGSDMAWTGDARSLVVLRQHDLLAVNATSGSIERSFAVPRGLPTQWLHALLPYLNGTRLVLMDTVSGQTWRATAR